MSSQKRFSQLILIVIAGMVIAVTGGGIWYYKKQVTMETSSKESPPVPIKQSKATETIKPAKTPTSTPIPTSVQNSKVSWSFNGQKWQASGNPPNCPNPLTLLAPADVNLASGILYPGQIRGGDYKPHGGFRFDNHTNNEVDVYAPMDGNLFKAARHLESGEVQYSLYFINNCGIMYKLDHLLKLTVTFEKMFNSIPMGGEGDSRTTEIQPAVFVAKGEHIATKIGFEKSRNIFFDFGLYDLRKKNDIVYDAVFRAEHSNINEYGTYALCWLDYLKEPDKALVKNLPAGGLEGKTSDYCK